MSELVEFLRARLDEDEGAARERLSDNYSQYGQAELDPDHALRVAAAMRRIMARHSLDLEPNWGSRDQELALAVGAIGKAASCSWTSARNCATSHQPMPTTGITERSGRYEWRSPHEALA